MNSIRRIRNADSDAMMSLFDIASLCFVASRLWLNSMFPMDAASRAIASLWLLECALNMVRIILSSS